MRYEQKFSGLLQLCEDAKRGRVDAIVIHHPEVLGDTYEEMVESLNRIAAAGLKLAIVPRTERDPPRN
jgi:hypothetical protein